MPCLSSQWMGDRPWQYRGAFYLTAFVGLCLALTCMVACTPEIPLPTTTPETTIPLPTPTQLPLPDLTVNRLIIRIPNINTCVDFIEQMSLVVEVANQGRGSATPFIVEMNGAWQYVESGLQPGQVISIEFSEVTAEARVLVDVNDQVMEVDERNNAFINQLDLPALPQECLSTPTPPALLSQGPQFSLLGHTGKIFDLAFSPDGNVLASGGADDTLRLWQVNRGPSAEGALLRTMQGHPFQVLCVAYSPSGSLLATGSTDHLIRLWRVSDGALLRTMAGHGDWVTRLAFSPDERFLASASQDYTVRIWRVINGRLQQTIDEGLSGVTDLAYAPDGNTLAWSEADSSVRIFDLADDRFSQILPAGGPAATSITFYQSENIQDSHIVAAGYADGRVRIWDTRDGALMTEFVSHINSPVTSLDFSRSGNLLVTASRDARLRLWQVDVTRGDTPQTTLSPTDTTTSQVSSEPQMQIRAALVLLGHEAPITRAIFSPQGNWIASASEDGVILVWSIPGTDTRPEE